MRQHYAGTTVRLAAVFRHPVTETLTDPDGGATVTAIDPDGLAKVTAVSMTKESVGSFFYNLATATTWVKGDYKVEVKAIHGSLTSLICPSLFKLV